MRIRSVEDRLFLRFRRAGDARALGRLFDRTAPDLLKVARYLAADRAAAEDLVQATFLRAIEHAAGYDQTRAVLPWLIGILTHLAIDQRRARERATRAATAPPPAPDPAAAAADAEFHAACRAAVRGLPPLYREVIALHLDAGLSAAEIAQRLARPADTVRKQLARGLALLRRSLPAGFAGAFAVGVTPACELAAMRAIVTSRAAAVGAGLASAATTVAVGAVVLMKKMLVASVVLAAALGAFARWAPVDIGRGVDPDASPSLSSSREEAATQPLVVAAERPASTQERSLVARPPTSMPRCTIRGRCLDGNTGAGLQGCGVTLTWGFDREAARRADLPPDKHHLAEATSAADGRFEVAVDSPAALWCLGEVRRAGYVPLSSEAARLAAGGTHDFGDVVLVPGCTVRGRVLDTAGRPHTEGLVWLTRQVHDNQAVWRRQETGNDHARADGTFAIPEALPPGRYNLKVNGSQVVEPRVVDIGVERELLLTVTVRARDEIPAIEGTILDPTGAGVARVRIHRFDPRGAAASRAVESDRSGRFRFERGEAADDSDGPFQLQLDAEGFQTTTTPERYGWGTAGLHLTLQRGAPVIVEVTDAETGAPIEQYGVRWQPHPRQRPQGSPTRTDLRHEERHAAGRLAFPVWRGRMFLEIVPADAGYAPSAPLAVDVADGIAPLQVRLTRRRPTVLRIETQDARPVVGTEVEVLQPQFDCPVDRSTFVSRSGYDSSTGPNVAHAVARGVSDANGELGLMLPHDRPLAVRVLGPGHPVVVTPARSFGAEPTVIVVPIGAKVRGTVEPLSRLAEFSGAAVQLRRTDGQHDVFPPTPGSRGIVLDPSTGAFEMSGVPAGTWALTLTWVEGGDANHAERLAEVTLRDGEARAATFSLDPIQFVRARLHVFVDGAPVDGTVHAGVNLPLRAGLAEGRVRVGEQRPVAYFHRGPNRVEAPLRPGFTARAGETIERRYELSFGTLRLHLVDADGRPVAAAHVLAGLRGAQWGRELTLSDAEGRIEAQDFPLGRYSLRIDRLPLTDAVARSAFFAANPGAGWQDLSVPFGDVEVTEVPHEHRLVVPPAALR